MGESSCSAVMGEGPGAGQQLGAKAVPSVGRWGARLWLGACLLMTMGAFCAWVLATAAPSAQPDEPWGARARKLPVPVSGKSFELPRVVYGHVHVAKTGGTSLNGNLSVHFERVCGHKGWSYDAIQANERRRTEARTKDSFARSHEHYSRSRVPHDIMTEIGFEDCDWISNEERWVFWQQFQSWGTPLELHIPCRDPLDHLMSQCNYRGKVLDCAGDLAEQADACLLHASRFSGKLAALNNTALRCFDWRAALDGRYFDHMAERLQQRRFQVQYGFWATNKPRNRTRECIWEDPEARAALRQHLLRLEYYRFCDTCIGSERDLFAPQSDP